CRSSVSARPPVRSVNFGAMPIGRSVEAPDPLTLPGLIAPRPVQPAPAAWDLPAESVQGEQAEDQLRPEPVFEPVQQYESLQGLDQLPGLDQRQDAADPAAHQGAYEPQQQLDQPLEQPRYEGMGFEQQPYDQQPYGQQQ